MGSSTMSWAGYITHLQECCRDAGAGVSLRWQDAGVILHLVAVVIPTKVGLVTATGRSMLNERMHMCGRVLHCRDNTDTVAGCCRRYQSWRGCFRTTTHSNWLLVGRDLAARGVCETMVRLACLGPFPLVLSTAYSSSLLTSPRA